MRRPAAATAACVFLAALLGAGCGYHVSGHADLLPVGIHTIAVPPFTNNTTRYKLTEQLPEAITQEFITRTRYRVVPDPKDADAVLTGTVVSYSSYPTTLDPATGRASAVQVSVVLDVALRDRATGALLFSQDKTEYRERYEISVNESTYFDESDEAMFRLSRDVARSVVSAILERF